MTEAEADPPRGEVTLVHQQEADVHRLGTVVESRTLEVLGKPGDPRAPMSLDALKQAGRGGPEIPFEQAPTGRHARRLVGRTRVHFYDDALTMSTVLGVVGKRALPAKSLAMAFTEGHAAQVLAPLMVAALEADAETVLRAGGYLNEDGAWWVPSSRTVFSPVFWM